MRLLIIALLLVYNIAISQPNTEVYLMEIQGNSKLEFSNFKNISNNYGYDNQPSFVDNNTLLFTKTRNGQTDVYSYFITKNIDGWLTDSKQGSEYSPVSIPNTKDFAAVRLDTNGLQRLYRHSMEIEPKTISNEEIAYYTFFDKNTVVASILGGNTLDLIVYTINEDKTYRLLKGSGRSIHKIPNNNEAVSYTAVNEKNNHDIYQLDMDTLESFFIAELPIGIQDHIWLTETTLLCGSGAKLYYYDLFGDGEWEEAADLSDKNIKDITRMAISPDEKKLALVAETYQETSPTNPTTIVNKQLEAYNKRDIDAFMKTYTQDIKLYNFPNNLSSEGQKPMRESFESFFSNTPDLHCEIKNRIVIGNKVIDEEYITANGQNFSAVAIYEIENGLIAKVTFIR